MYKTSLSVSHDRSQIRSSLISRLLSMSDSADDLGLTKMSTKLESLATELRFEFRQFEEAISADIDGAFDSSQKATAENLKAILNAGS